MPQAGHCKIKTAPHISLKYWILFCEAHDNAHTKFHRNQCVFYEMNSLQMFEARFLQSAFLAYQLTSDKRSAIMHAPIFVPFVSLSSSKFILCRDSLKFCKYCLVFSVSAQKTKTSFCKK